VLPEGREIHLANLVALGEPMSTPTRRIRSSCCARIANGHAAAAPPMSDMNSRRFMLDMGLPPVLVASTLRGDPTGRRRRSVCPMLNLPHNGQQVLGTDLNGSESR